MAYPPLPHTERDPAQLIALIRAYPFAHLFTSGKNGPLVTQLPFMVDTQDGKITGLRAHLSGLNPQRPDLDDGDALVAFSGPGSYVSPNWRVDKGRGGTWDYTSVHVWGRITLRPEKAFFTELINDLSALIEPQFDGVSDAPVWSTKDSPDGYIDRLLPKLTAFEIDVTRVQGITKLHQDFPAEDALSVADHLGRSALPESQQVAAQIKQRAKKR